MAVANTVQAAMIEGREEIESPARAGDQRRADVAVDDRFGDRFLAAVGEAEFQPVVDADLADGAPEHRLLECAIDC